MWVKPHAILLGFIATDDKGVMPPSNYSEISFSNSWKCSFMQDRKFRHSLCQLLLFYIQKGKERRQCVAFENPIPFFLSENSFDFWSERLCYYGVQRLCYSKIPKPSIQDKPPLQFLLITEKYVEISFTGQIKQLSTWEAIQNTLNFDSQLASLSNVKPVSSSKVDK